MAMKPCPHGRPSWRSCPHCLGVNNRSVPKPDAETMQPWEVLDNDEAAAIAEFGNVSVATVRAVEMLVLLKAGKTRIGG